MFPKLYAALNFCFFCFKTKDNEKRKKDGLKYKVNKCIEILSKDNVLGKFYTLVASLREVREKNHNEHFLEYANFNNL